MRIFKQVILEGKVILTVSLWGDDGHEEAAQDLLNEVIDELNAQLLKKESTE